MKWINSEKMKLETYYIIHVFPMIFLYYINTYHVDLIVMCIRIRQFISRYYQIPQKQKSYFTLTSQLGLIQGHRNMNVEVKYRRDDMEFNCTE